MADHVRKQIRDYVASALTGLPTTGSNVYSGRVYRLADENLPALLVFTNREQSQPDTMAADGDIERVMDLEIEGYAKVGADLDDVLDQIAAEVEAVMGADRNLGSLAEDSFLDRSDITLQGDGDNSAGVLQLTYRVAYRTGIADPTVVM